MNPAFNMTRLCGADDGLPRGVDVPQGRLMVSRRIHSAAVFEKRKKPRQPFAGGASRLLFRIG